MVIVRAISYRYLLIIVLGSKRQSSTKLEGQLPVSFRRTVAWLRSAYFFFETFPHILDYKIYVVI